MYDIFHTPWPIAIASVVVWLIVSMIRLTMPDKGRKWHMLIPLLMLISAFAIDYFVQTDREKLDTVIDNSIAAAVACDIAAIDALVAADYSDRVHRSKPAIMSAAKRFLREPILEKVKKTNCLITVNNASATINIAAIVHLNPQSQYAAVTRIVPIKMEIECTKTPDGVWLVSSANITAVNNTAATWNSF